MVVGGEYISFGSTVTFVVLISFHYLKRTSRLSHFLLAERTQKNSDQFVLLFLLFFCYSIHVVITVSRSKGFECPLLLRNPA